MLQVALIGVTGYASIHLAMLRSFAKEGRLRLRAVTAINRPQAEEVCRELEAEGSVVHRDYREMLAACTGHIDLCIIPTSPHLHAVMTVAALEAGANVLLEKPLAPTLADIDSILAAERRTGRWVAVGFQDFYAPELTSVCQRLASGEWGAVRRVSSLCLWPRSFEYYGRNSWAGRLRADGHPVFDSPLSNAMAHFAMTMLRLSAPAGRPATHLVAMNADLRRAYPIESFDTIALRARTENGVDFLFAGSHACPHNRAVEIVVQAEHARIVWIHDTSLVIETAQGVESLPITSAAGARLNQLEAVLARFSNPNTLLCTTEIGAEHARLYIQLHANIAIADVPAAEIVEEEHDHQTWRWIRGIERELETFVEHAPFSAVPFSGRS
jgi:predicted dehydrogenase